MRTTNKSKQGFTLIEIMVVVVVIGVLASIAVPFFRQYLRNSRAAAFASDIRILANAGTQFALESGWWVEDGYPGVFPEELQGYFSERKYNLGSPLGGKWDFEQDDIGDITSAVGVYNPTEGDDIFMIVDKRIDDGDLSSGYFQKIENRRYYYIIEE